MVLLIAILQDLEEMLYERIQFHGNQKLQTG